MSAADAPVPLAAPSAWPVESVAYHQFYRTPRLRWWRPVVAFLLAAALWLMLLLVLVVPAIMADGVPETGVAGLGPWAFLANNLWLALAVPVAMLTQWAVFGQRPRWLSSVAGGFRWAWFGRSVAVVLPVWVVLLGVQYLLAPPDDLRVREYTVLLAVGILLTTPFQAAGEEYLLRGLLPRLVGAWIRNPAGSWAASTTVSSLAFTALHFAADPWLNLYYVAFAVAASWLVWRTGGLEAAVAVHVVNNMLSEVILPFSDIGDVFNREVGTGDPTVLLNIGALGLVAGLLAVRGRRAGLQTHSVPARPEMPSGPGWPAGSRLG